MSSSPRPVQSEHRKGVLAGTGAYLIWGLFPLYFHRLKAIRPVELACWRIVLTSVVVWVALAIRHDTRWMRALLAERKRLVFVAGAGVMIGLNWLIYLWAVVSGHVVDAAIGYFINPLIAVALGVVLLRERLRPAQQGALAFGFAAVCVLTIAYGNVPWVALSLACTFGLYGYLKKVAGLDGLRSLAAETLAMLPVGVIGLAVMASHGTGQRDGLGLFTASASTTALTLLVGVITAVPLVLFGVAAKRIPLALVGLLQYVSPVGQLACGVLAFGESVSAARWAGIALVCVALVILAVDLVRTMQRSAVVATAG